MSDKKLAVLVLSDGSTYFGRGIGAECIKSGELVFNTSMTGYQEALTDPSYAGQILMMTYPLIGNYGFSKEYTESKKVWVEGFVLKWAEKDPHHYKSDSSLEQYLKQNNTGCIYEIDTRMLTRKIRNFGVIPAALQVYSSGKSPDLKKLKEMALSTKYSNANFIPTVSCKSPQTFGISKKKVVLIDYGAKGNIIFELNKRGIQVILVPHNTPAEDILSQKPNGILLSNGPGDPAILKQEISQIKKLFGKLPIFGICLGHQLIAHASGATTYKLKFGHRGSNHPVMDKELNKVFITTQNHGFAVDEKSIPKDWEITHVNLNDNTCEGMQHKKMQIFCVQYHPEAHPGPRDSDYLFDKFVKML
ncbi:MAG: glutamine-hydrolyzing carbamoyl-phosphate synthase small subunit [Candidatus Micrarchaeia archaeon]